MRARLSFATESVEYDIPDDQWLALTPADLPTALPDVAVTLRTALAQPLRYPPLRQCLVPDDRVAIVVDEALPLLTILLTGVLDEIVSAGVEPSAITLLVPPGSHEQPWLDDLPEQYQEVRIEVHDPTHRNRVTYLTATRDQQPLYLNETAALAGALVLLTGRRFDARFGYAGAEAALYPLLGDQTARRCLNENFSLEAPQAEPWPIRHLAAEAAREVNPFLVQVIEAMHDGVACILTGTLDSSADGVRHQDAVWRKRVECSPATVLTALSGDPARHTFVDLAMAAYCAARIVEDGGRIGLLSRAAPDLGPAGELLRGCETPAQALKRLDKDKPADALAAFLWASAARRARLYVLSAWPDDLVEDLFATPMQRAEQGQRLIAAGGRVLLVPDAHKMLVEVVSDDPSKGRS